MTRTILEASSSACKGSFWLLWMSWYVMAFFLSINFFLCFGYNIKQHCTVCRIRLKQTDSRTPGWEVWFNAYVVWNINHCSDEIGKKPGITITRWLIMDGFITLHIYCHWSTKTIGNQFYVVVLASLVIRELKSCFPSFLHMPLSNLVKLNQGEELRKSQTSSLNSWLN